MVKIKLFFLSLSIMILSSCTDKFVDLKPEYTPSADNFFQQKSDYDSALNAAYDPLQWLYANWLLGDIASDNSLCGGESAVDTPGFQEIDDMRHNPSNDNLATIFKNLYTGVFRTNYIFENQNKLDFTGKDKILAQTAFLRAFYYFELVKFFGDVPLYVDKRLNYGEQFEINRSPKADVYAQIEKDLIYAHGILEWTTTEKGRITKGAALTLLGKVYLYQEKFNECHDVLGQVISSNKYSLVTDFGQIFLSDGENNSESVFEIQHSEKKEWYDWNYYQGSEGNFAIIHNGIRGWVGSVFANGWSFNIPTKELYDAFTSGDNRRDYSILNIETYIASTQPNATFSKGYEHTGYYNLKYISRTGQSSAQIELNYNNNQRVIRYSDVLLMEAEALNRGNINNPQALNYLNMVRSRAGLSPLLGISGNTLRDKIWEERRLELAMEGDRFFDLVRTKQAASKITGFVTGKHEVFPIPQTEMDLSGNRWTQNAGY